MSKDVLDYVESIARRVSKARWTPAPEPAPAAEPQASIPEDDADLLAYREELLTTQGTTEE